MFRLIFSLWLLQIVLWQTSLFIGYFVRGLVYVESSFLGVELLGHTVYVILVFMPYRGVQHRGKEPVSPQHR